MIDTAFQNLVSGNASTRAPMKAKFTTFQAQCFFYCLFSHFSHKQVRYITSKSHSSYGRYLNVIMMEYPKKKLHIHTHIYISDFTSPILIYVSVVLGSCEAKRYELNK